MPRVYTIATPNRQPVAGRPEVTRGRRRAACRLRCDVLPAMKPALQGLLCNSSTRGLSPPQSRSFQMAIELHTEAGMKAIIGIVPSHSSDEHEGFQAALKAGKTSLESERYIFRDGLDPTWTSLPRTGSSRRTRTPDEWRNVFKYSRCQAPLEPQARVCCQGWPRAGMLVSQHDPTSFCEVITESLGLR